MTLNNSIRMRSEITDIQPDSVKICGVTVKRSVSISRSEWLDFWGGLIK